MTSSEINHKTLFFITANFPYGSDETFIENEINYLSNSFDKIIIISHNVDSHAQRKTNDNVKVIRRPYSIGRFGHILSISGIFNKHFWKEIKIVKKTYQKKLSTGILKTILISLYNAKRLNKQYAKIISKHSNSNNHNYCYSYWCNDSALALTYIKLKNPTFKTFCRIHRWDVYFEESKYNYLPYRHLIYENLDAIFSISSDGIRYAEVNWELQDIKKFKLSRLGVNNKFEIEFTDNAIFKLVSCSNLIPVKRVDLIMESLKALENVSLEWIVIGDGDLREELEQQISKLPLSVKVNFLGRINNRQIYELYNELNPQLFINLSSSEGVPVSIMEAMSFGTPVIATNVGGTSEIVNNKNGSLLEANPSKLEVASKIQEFYNLTVEEKTKKRKAAFDTWNVKYNADKNYSQFVEDILSL
jgi:glycosyltransferase involved in cell wall biosynthesis